MNISPEEAAQALNEIKASQAAMRSLVRAHRGHLYLWLWGAIWIVTSVLAGREPARWTLFSDWLSLAGLVATIAIGAIQRQQVKTRVDRRFLGVVVALLVFDYGVWPFILGIPHSFNGFYGYGMLIWMQIYVVGGIWFANYLLWIGIAVTALVLVGFLAFPASFWIFSLLGGATLVGTGTYVRLAWK